jgi:hypothetical protein
LCIGVKIKRILARKRIEKITGGKNLSYELIDADRRTKSGRHTLVQKRIRRKIKSNKKRI